MLIIGLDAAAQYNKFGYAIGNINAGRVELKSSGILRSEAAIDRLIVPCLEQSQPCVIAVDAPLGWPKAMPTSLSTHLAGQAVETTAHEMFRRYTDNHVRSTYAGAQPLDVGADRIARASWRALHVLQFLRRRLNRSIPLAWRNENINDTVAIEVYPAATLRARNLYSKGYGKPDAVEVRERIAVAVSQELPWLPDKVRVPCHEFDAAICLLAAFDFLLGRAIAPPVGQAGAVAQEGWIWVKAPVPTQ